MIKLMLKDKTTEKLRQLIINQIPTVHETDDAEPFLTALSLQSKLYPNRHIWIDTDLDGIIGIDLEDWDIEDEWDNAIARLKMNTLAQTVELIQLWVSGATLSDWYEGLNQEYLAVRKKVVLSMAA